MSQAKHTPGPWTQGTSNEGLSCVWLDGLTEPELEMGPDSKWIDCNTPANARLIAAAPTMYSYIETKALNGDDEAKQILETIHASR